MDILLCFRNGLTEANAGQITGFAANANGIYISYFNIAGNVSKLIKLNVATGANIWQYSPACPANGFLLANSSGLYLAGRNTTFQYYVAKVSEADASSTWTWTDQVNWSTSRTIFMSSDNYIWLTTNNLAGSSMMIIKLAASNGGATTVATVPTNNNHTLYPAGLDMSDSLWFFSNSSGVHTSLYRYDAWFSYVNMQIDYDSITGANPNQLFGSVAATNSSRIYLAGNSGTLTRMTTVSGAAQVSWQTGFGVAGDASSAPWLQEMVLIGTSVYTLQNTGGNAVLTRVNDLTSPA